MNKITHIADLPLPLAHIAAAFITMDTYEPEISEATPDEMMGLRREEDVVFQLILDKEWYRWYLVAVGDVNRMKRSQYIIHDPFDIKRSILVFAEVDDDWIRARRKELERKEIYPGQAQVWGDGLEFSLEELEALLN